MDKKYCIYMHKNKINGKVYIGQTCQKPEYRWNHGEGYKECPAFYAAIQKYGWDNFEHIILENNLTFAEADEREKYYIQKYNSLNKNFGYNIQKGGLNHTVTQESKEKSRQHTLQLWSKKEHREHISQIMKEKWQDEEYIKKQQLARKEKPHIISEEGRKRISEARKKYIAEHGTPTQGVGHSEETKQKLREAQLGSKNSMYGKHHTEEWKQKNSQRFSCPIQCIETGQIFPSRKEAAEWCGLKSSSGISDQLAGRKKSAGTHPETGEKLHWKSLGK